ncbi:MAG: bifunctional shikimate kinase/3-dehydroquinate synthase [Solirubrobacterales bacterium]|nr:bifunctional shikimate kinase/3-dehydroquinate synthase [Solirubrobacterales bacterium]
MTILTGQALVLVGFMGAGKSTAAKSLDSSALDTDRIIEQESGLTVAEIFARDGEVAFRDLEQRTAIDAINRAAAGEGGGVVSLGGGALNSEAIRSALKEHVVVMLDISVEEAWRRCSGSQRPLASDREAFWRLHAERESSYLAAADAMLPASTRSAVKEALPAIRRIAESDHRVKLLWASTGGGSYPVFVGSGMLGTFDPGIDGRSALIGDRNVASLYFDRFEESLARIEFPAGEINKTITTCSEIWREMAGAHVTREDHVVAVGGGVVGDVAGFAAAAYQRGIPVVHWPTTVVAQVDSSLGGKTGVDIPEGKNYVGAFHQPAAVVSDFDALSTLPKDEYSSGMAEVIKTALIAGGSLWERVIDGQLLDPDMVLACARTKIAIVSSDEFDSGMRQLLNLGHTVGHAIETATNYSRLRHGEAVGIGLLAALQLSGAGQLRDSVSQLLLANGLPTSVEGVDIEAALHAVKSDKKARSDGSVPFVLCSEPGSVTFGNAVDASDLETAMREVLT